MDNEFISSADILDEIADWPEALIKHVGIKAFLVKTPYHKQDLWILVNRGDTDSYNKLYSQDQIVITREELDMFFDAQRHGILTSDVISSCLRTKRIYGGFSLSISGRPTEKGLQEETKVESGIEQDTSRYRGIASKDSRSAGAAGLF